MTSCGFHKPQIMVISLQFLCIYLNHRKFPHTHSKLTCTSSTLTFMHAGQYCLRITSPNLVKMRYPTSMVRQNGTKKCLPLNRHFAKGRLTKGISICCQQKTKHLFHLQIQHIQFTNFGIQSPQSIFQSFFDFPIDVSNICAGEDPKQHGWKTRE